MSDTRSAAPALSPGLNARLSMMMFLQYAIWGAWLPLLWPFLAGHRGFSGPQIGDMFAVGAIGAIVAPFIAGQIADRYFRTEIYLALSHIVGGVLIWQLAGLETYGAFLAFSLIYSLVYSPTLALTNSLSFHHLPDRDRDFGKVRVWGTIGWIVVGIGIGQWLKAEYTIDADESARRVVSERILDEKSRTRLTTLTQVTLNDGRTTVGRLEESSDAAVIVLQPEAEKQDDGTEKIPDPIRLAKADVKSVDPLSTVLAAEGQADLIAVALLDAAAPGANADAITDRLVAAKAFNEDTLAGPIAAEHQRGMQDAFRLSAILGILMGLFCFMLPKTPPTPGREKNASLEALGEVRKQPLLTLFLLAVPISCIHQFYFVHTAGFLGQFKSGFAEQINAVFGVGGGGLMTVGQMVEIAVLAAMPVMAVHLSRKVLLAAGIVAYGLRMALFAYAPAIEAATGIPAVALVVFGVGLHGFCFGCFIFVAFMVVDEETTPDVRASAQSLFNLVIVGIGIIVGSKIAGYVGAWATTTDSLGDDSLDYTALFSVPMWASLACLVILLVLYPGRRTSAAE